jgi:hypothetical protein
MPNDGGHRHTDLNWWMIFTRPCDSGKTRHIVIPRIQTKPNAGVRLGISSKGFPLASKRHRLRYQSDSPTGTIPN